MITCGSRSRPPWRAKVINSFPVRCAPAAHRSSAGCEEARRSRPSFSCGAPSESSDTFSMRACRGPPPTGSPSSFAAATGPWAPSSSHDRACPAMRHASAAALPAQRPPSGFHTTARRQRLRLLLPGPGGHLLRTGVEGDVVDTVEIEREHVVDRPQRPVAVELQLLVLRAVAAERESLRRHFHAIPARSGLLAAGLRRLARRFDLRRIEIASPMARRGAPRTAP